MYQTWDSLSDDCELLRRFRNSILFLVYPLSELKIKFYKYSYLQSVGTDRNKNLLVKFYLLPLR